MMRKALRVSLAVLALVTTSVAVGCERREPTVTLRVDADLLAKVRARGETLMARPDVELAFNQYLDATFADPALLASAGTLVDALVADPTLSAGLTRFMDRLAHDPAIAQVVGELMREHPDWTPDQIGEATGERTMVGYQPHSGLVGAVIMDALGDVTTTPAWTAFQARVTAPLAAKLSAFVETPARERKWSTRLRALAGGKTPDPRQAAELYVEHAWSEDRMAGFVKEVLADPGVREASAAMVRGVIAEPEVRKAIVTACANLLSTPTVDDRLLATFLLFLHGGATTEEVTARLQALFDPATRAELARMLATVLGEPKVQALVGDAIAAIGERAPIRAAVDRLLDSW